MTDDAAKITAAKMEIQIVWTVSRLFAEPPDNMTVAATSRPKPMNCDWFSLSPRNIEVPIKVRMGIKDPMIGTTRLASPRARAAKKTQSDRIKVDPETTIQNSPGAAGTRTPKGSTAAASAPMSPMMTA